MREVEVVVGWILPRSSLDGTQTVHQEFHGRLSDEFIKFFAWVGVRGGSYIWRAELPRERL